MSGGGNSLVCVGFYSLQVSTVYRFLQLAHSRLLDFPASCLVQAWGKVVATCKAVQQAQHKARQAHLQDIAVTFHQLFRQHSILQTWHSIAQHAQREQARVQQVQSCTHVFATAHSPDMVKASAAWLQNIWPGTASCSRCVHKLTAAGRTAWPSLLRINRGTFACLLAVLPAWCQINSDQSL